MRRLNMFLAAGMLVTFVLHAVAGALKLLGADSGAMKAAAWTCLVLAMIHAAVSVVLTFQTVHVQRVSGAAYFKDNLIFWARRISGLALIIPLVMHVLLFQADTSGGAVRLQVFTQGRLVSQILLVLTIAFHVLTNIEPMLISFGIKSTKAFSHDAMFVLSVVLLLACVGFGAYYARWAAV